MKPKLNRKGDLYVPQGMDACQTPPHALAPLLPYLPPQWVAWEPAAGEGLLVNALLSWLTNVRASDLAWDDGDNFFDYEPIDYDVQITNPPYSIKYKWLRRSYELGKPFALLLPLEALGAQQAQKLFRQYGLELITLDRRVNFKMPNKGWSGSSAQFPVAWFTWGLNIGSPLTFAVLPKEPMSLGEVQNV